MKKKMLFFLVLFFFCYTFAEQDFFYCCGIKSKITVDEYNKEAEAILNTIINSVPFDSINSIYSDAPSYVVFAENEILYEGIPITLTYKNQKVKIVDCSQVKENCYWVADFFLDFYIKNPKNASVQIELVPKNKNMEGILVGIILEKHKKWQIKSFTLIE
jgi:hypothetical protein